MTIIPWPTMSFNSSNFPLLYHLAVNLGQGGNSTEHWDRRLEETWNDPGRHWPTLYRIVSLESVVDSNNPAPLLFATVRKTAD